MPNYRWRARRDHIRDEHFMRDSITVQRNISPRAMLILRDSMLSRLATKLSLRRLDGLRKLDDVRFFEEALDQDRLKFFHDMRHLAL